MISNTLDESDGLNSDIRNEAVQSDYDNFGLDDCLPLWCQDFLKCKKQIWTTFGYVLTGRLITYSGMNVVLQQITDMIIAHRLFKDVAIQISFIVGYSWY